MSRVTFLVADLDETTVLAGHLASVLNVPARVGLSGDLGVGKTTFTAALVSALHGDGVSTVSSPTWAICNTYPGPPRVLHLDLYRLDGDADGESIGIDELGDDAILVAEWPERLPEFASTLDLHLTMRRADDDARRVRAVALSARGAVWLQAWTARVRGDQAQSEG